MLPADESAAPRWEIRAALCYHDFAAAHRASAKYLRARLSAGGLQ